MSNYFTRRFIHHENPLFTWKVNRQHNRKKLMQIFQTRMCNVTAWRQSRMRAYWLMALVAGGWGGITRELQRLLSLIGYGCTGGVCLRSLTAGKILFTRRQTCSLYFVLRLCLQGKFFYYVTSFQNSMRKSFSGAENLKKWKYVQQNSIYNTYINFFYILQLNK